MNEEIIAKKRTAIVKCGWCRKDFETNVTIRKRGYEVKVCPYCARTVNSSRKEPTGSLVGRKHIHSDLKDGDIV
jgi:uncharacterized CHY-type Zn-finger protein